METTWSDMRAQPHLDPLVLLVPQGHVLEASGSNDGVQLAVEDVQHVAVERGGDPLGVVVGGQQAGPVLDQVGPEQEAVPVGHDAVEVEEEAPRAGRASRFPMVLPRKATSRRPSLGTRSMWRWKSPTTAWTRSPGYSSARAVAAAHRVPSLTSSGHVAPQRLRSPAMASSRTAGLVAGPRAQLDQGVGLGGGGDLGRGPRGAAARPGSGSTRAAA